MWDLVCGCVFWVCMCSVVSIEWRCRDLVVVGFLGWLVELVLIGW